MFQHDSRSRHLLQTFDFDIASGLKEEAKQEAKEADTTGKWRPCLEQELPPPVALQHTCPATALCFKYSVKADCRLSPITYPPPTDSPYLSLSLILTLSLPGYQGRLPFEMRTGAIADTRPNLDHDCSRDWSRD